MLLCTNQSGMLGLPRSLNWDNLHRDDQIWKRIVKRNVGKSPLEIHQPRDSHCYMYVYVVCVLVIEELLANMRNVHVNVHENLVDLSSTCTCMRVKVSNLSTCR